MYLDPHHCLKWIFFSFKNEKSEIVPIPNHTASAAAGSSLLPPGGWSELSPLLQISWSAAARGSLPTAHTCFNLLVLPDAENYQQLERVLLTAVREGSEGFLIMWEPTETSGGIKFHHVGPDTFDWVKLHYVSPETSGGVKFLYVNPETSSRVIGGVKCHFEECKEPSGGEIFLCCESRVMIGGTYGYHSRHAKQDTLWRGCFCYVKWSHTGIHTTGLAT